MKEYLMNKYLVLALTDAMDFILNCYYIAIQCSLDHTSYW